MVINFIHNEDDTYSPLDADTTFNYNSSFDFEYAFWKKKYNFIKWFTVESIDLLYISFAVFSADRLCSRDKSLDNWSRTFKLYIPVLSNVWTENVKALEEMLAFLSGDSWKIVFRKREFTDIEVKSEARWEKDKNRINYNHMCMFSGGLDSFIGAIDLLEEVKGKESVLFVSHYGGGKGTKEYQDKLKSHLIETYGLDERDFLQFHAAVIDGVEETTRTRSFMFFSHAIALATAMDKPIQLYIPENGVISLNIPMTYSRIGTSSTRTTHPYYLNSFRKLLEDIGIEIMITNPYQFKTKGEMLIECRNQEFLKKNLRFTMSCSHPDVGRHYGEKETMHCGYCLPCVIRKSAIKRANLADLSRYYDSKGELVKEAKICINSYRQGIEDFCPKYAFMTIQQNGNISDHIDDYADLYIRGMNEIKEYVEEL